MLTLIHKLFAIRAARRPQGRRKDGVARTVHPQLESLEERQVPAIDYHGGPLLQTVEVQGVYLGDQWYANPTLYNQTGYLEGFLGTIVNSSYMDMLSNAGYRVGRGSATGGLIASAALADGSTLDDSTIQSLLSGGVQNGSLQYPDANRLYVVFVEPSVEVTNGSQDSAHNFASYHNAFAGPNGTTIRYAVVPYPGGSTNNLKGNPNLGDLQDMTMVASHEIAEGATDPDGGYGTAGWYGAFGFEIADYFAGQTVYVNGYAMQRIASPFAAKAMTPASATSDRAVNFVLQSNGDLYEIVNGSPAFVASGIASVSPQGIDNNGHAMIDAVTSGGDAWEYHDEVGGYSLGGSVRSAVAGQGVSYVLFTNGDLKKYDDATGTWNYLFNGVSQIAAGTDKLGITCVDIVFSSGVAQEYSDESFTYIGGTTTNHVQSISAGRQGTSAYVTSDGVAHFHQEFDGHYYNTDVVIASNVAQVTAGTDANGNWLIDVLTTDGTVSELRSGASSWATLAGSVTSLSKGPLDAVDMVFSSGDAWQYSGAGWNYLGSNAAAAA
jgi:hypothetical protein